MPRIVKDLNRLGQYVSADTIILVTLWSNLYVYMCTCILITEFASYNYNYDAKLN